MQGLTWSIALRVEQSGLTEVLGRQRGVVSLGGLVSEDEVRIGAKAFVHLLDQYQHRIIDSVQVLSSQAAALCQRRKPHTI